MSSSSSDAIDVSDTRSDKSDKTDNVTSWIKCAETQQWDDEVANIIARKSQHLRPNGEVVVKTGRLRGVVGKLLDVPKLRVRFCTRSKVVLSKFDPDDLKSRLSETSGAWSHGYGRRVCRAADRAIVDESSTAEFPLRIVRGATRLVLIYRFLMCFGSVGAFKGMTCRVGRWACLCFVYDIGPRS